MKLGKVSDPSLIDFTLPRDHHSAFFDPTLASSIPNIRMGLPTWNKQKLENFYPKGAKDELSYYSSKFPSMMLSVKQELIHGESIKEKVSKNR